MCKKAGLIGDSMSSEKSSRITCRISCTEDILNFERGYKAKHGVLGRCGNGQWYRRAKGCVNKVPIKSLSLGCHGTLVAQGRKATENRSDSEVTSLS